MSANAASVGGSGGMTMREMRAVTVSLDGGVVAVLYVHLTCLAVVAVHTTDHERASDAALAEMPCGACRRTDGQWSQVFAEYPVCV